MGTNCLQDIPLNWGEIFYPASVDMDLNEMLKAHSAIFQEGLGKLEGISEWTTFIVPIVKEDGTIRIWGGYKKTINQQPS